MIVNVLIGLGVLIAGFLGYAARRPNQFRVQRSGRINAPPEKIFGLINDFHRWNQWSPWDKLDPSMTKSITGPPSGKGAVYEWEGNNKVGKGRMEILDSKPPRNVTIRLEFIKPFKVTNTTEFTLEPSGSATDVTWLMYGPSPFMSKVMGVFMDMDKMIGKDFEKGIDNLRAAAQG